MARCEISMFSRKLQKMTSLVVLLPEFREGVPYTDLPVLYLLHGRTDDHTAWTRFSSLERYVRDTNLVVVTPDAGLSYYQDMVYGLDYYSYISEEVPAFIQRSFPVSRRRERTFIAGLSMGGFGAFKIALNHPQHYSYAGSLSGVLDFPERVEKSLKSRGAAWSSIFRNCFGDQITREQLLGTENDLIDLVTAADPGQLPQLFQCCGTEDFLYDNNQHFREACRGTSIPLTYTEGPGGHTWEYWDQAIQEFLKLLPL